MTEQTRFVRCKVSRGFFTTEFYVVLKDSSVFVNRLNVRVEHEPQAGEEVEGEVLAYLVDDSQKDGEALVELSGEPVVGGLRNWVAKTDLAAA